MNYKHIVLLAASCLLVCVWSECVPDPIENIDDPERVGTTRLQNTSSANIIKFIPFLNENKYNSTESNENLLILTCIKNATSQVVAGIKYELNVLFQKTNCLKSNVDLAIVSMPNLFKQKCQIVLSNRGESSEISARFIIFTQNWLNRIEVTDVTNLQ